MPVSEICNREVVVIQKNESVVDAAKLMRKHHVGDVLVVEDRTGIRVPVGIVTDRDLVMEVLAVELDGACLTVEEIMEQEVVTIQEGTGIFEAIQYMRQKAVRRLPVVNNQGGLIGILTLDDILELLSEELLALSHLVRREQQKEAKIRS